MRTIHVLQAGRDYFIDGIFWGDDAEGVMLYLSAKGVSPGECSRLERTRERGNRTLILHKYPYDR